MYSVIFVTMIRVRNLIPLLFLPRPSLFLPFFFSDFSAVFKCFTLLLKRLSKDIWNEASPEYPLTIFEIITTNPSYIAMLRTDIHEPTSTYVAWIQEYLSTARSFSTYTTIRDKAINFLFSEAALERSRNIAPALLQLSMNVRRL